MIIPDQSRATVFSITGMDCPSCAEHIAEAIKRLPDTEDARVDLISARLDVFGRDCDQEAIMREVRSLGYGIAPVEPATEAVSREREDPSLPPSRFTRVGIAALAVAAGGLGRWIGWSNALTIPLLAFGAIIGGYPIAIRGIASARRLRLDINFLMILAAIGAAVIGQWSEAGAIVVLFAVAEMLESLTVDHSRRAIARLLELKPRTALVLRDGVTSEIAVEMVHQGDLLLVKPGATIPVDGVVSRGSSSVNQAVVTGESLPVFREIGNEVYAGSINGDGALQIRASRAANDSTLDRIGRLVEEARQQRAPVQRLVDRFAAIYTPAVVLAAIFAAILPPLIWHGVWSVWLYRALTLLVVSCPCALVISTPVTIAAAIAGAARMGVLIKGGVHLESIRRIRAIALDKTGTITQGAIEVRQIHPLNGVTPKQLLQLTAALEAQSEHPIAAAIVRRAREEGVIPMESTNYRSHPGRGGEGIVAGIPLWVGNHSLFEELGICDSAIHDLLAKIERAEETAVLIGNSDKLYGIISLGDQIRPESKTVTNQLKSASGLHIALLTGDNHRTGEAVGSAIGADEVQSELTPDLKLSAVRSLQERYGATAMVGDGINDAPALAAADVGIAMGRGGADVSLETADIVLMGNRLDGLPWLLNHSRKTFNIIAANVSFAILTKLLFVALALTGKATLWMALFADMGVSLLVIMNGMRMLRIK